MSEASGSLLNRLIARVFPRMPKFFALLDEQCDLALETMQTFVAYLQSNDPDLAQKVRDLEHRADDIKERNIRILNESFSTPIDREDLYDAMSGIDQIINYAKTTVYELHMFEIPADECMRELGEELMAGVESLRAGFALLEKAPGGAEQYAKLAHKSERRMKKIYRSGLVKLFDKHKFRQQHKQEVGDDSVDLALDYVVYMMKHREIYRHLSHAADALGRDSEHLQDIIVKLV
jgi:uncharacterized protein Yka (UPF0111/DUF47 family)